jgi:predicted DNA-binding transcriptional regulator AlpA
MKQDQNLQALVTFDQLPDVARIALPPVCALYGVSQGTVWRRVQQGLIPKPVKDGGSTRWLAGDLKRALEVKP